MHTSEVRLYLNRAFDNPCFLTHVFFEIISLYIFASGAMIWWSTITAPYLHIYLYIYIFIYLFYIYIYICIYIFKCLAYFEYILIESKRFVRSWFAVDIRLNLGLSHIADGIEQLPFIRKWETGIKSWVMPPLARREIRRAVCETCW